ncbi:MAG: zinc ribbon domain-containing protein [Thermoplasmata archaeon]|nr:zinc ribbon domain-containing protein [Thermoplasmata archaeon]
MQLRVLFSIVNIGVFLALFALEFTIPRYSSLIFYALLGWFIGSFLLLRAPFMSRQVGRVGARPTPASTSTSTPLPSSALPGSPVIDGAEIGFCPHCGTNIAPGTLVCPACGKATRIG